jgi:hypothetical protein
MSRYFFSADVLANYVKAGQETTNPQELRLLAESSLDRVRLRVAENPNSPRDVLAHLAKDPVSEIRAAVAVNPACPKKLRTNIAKDEDASVRWVIAEDPHTDPELLRELADDTNPYVSVRAKKTLDALENRNKSHTFPTRRGNAKAGRQSSRLMDAMELA